MTDRILKPNELRRADTERSSYIAIVPNDTTFEQVMTPVFWANHVSAFLRPFGRVEVVRQDGSMDLDLRVLEAKPGMVKMRCLRKHVDDSNIERSTAATAEGVRADKEPAPEGYKIIHIPAGTERGYAVMVKSSGVYLKKGLPDWATGVALAKAHKAEAETALV